MATANDNLLGIFLKDRRAKLDPAAFGFDSTRRRTPGLRREEVAQRANVSTIWYTWLEQGRGGGPSADVLERVADALTLTAAEREHLFLLAQGRPPETRYQPADRVSSQLQRMIDALESSPAVVKNSGWDVIAWNRAAAAVLTDYAILPLEQRNIMRLVFHRLPRGKLAEWEKTARSMVATFRLEMARMGSNEKARALVEELSQSSPDFAAMWRENDVGSHGEGMKQVVHPVAGPLMLEYSTFAVDGQPDLGLIIYTPATVEDLAQVRLLVSGRSG